MNKNEFISQLNSKLASGEITRDELLYILRSHAGVSSDSTGRITANSIDTVPKRSFFSAANILYMIGGIILIIGVATLLFRFWDQLSSTIRIVLTLGIAIAAYSSGIILGGNAKAKGIATIMQIVSGILLPIGIFITLWEVGVHDIGPGWVAIVFIAITLIYSASLVLFKSLPYSFFSMFFGTISVYALTAYIVDSSNLFSNPDIIDDIFEYLTLAIGFGYLSLASYVRRTVHVYLSKILDSFGVIAILGSILALGGYKPTQSMGWEIVGILALIGGLYLASRTQNKRILRSTAIFIFIFIGKFTAEYFADSMGWPIALMIGGLVLIGTGFALVTFNKSISSKK
jgi:hypothetical protein